MSRFDDPLHDQRMEDRDRSERDLARQYAADTIRLADPEPPRRREHKPTRPAGPQWGDDITDPINAPSIPTQAEYESRVAARRRRFPW